MSEGYVNRNSKLILRNKGTFLRLRVTFKSVANSKRGQAVKSLHMRSRCQGFVQGVTEEVTGSRDYKRGHRIGHTGKSCHTMGHIGRHRVKRSYKGSEMKVTRS